MPSSQTAFSNINRDKVQAQQLESLVKKQVDAALAAGATPAKDSPPPAPPSSAPDAAAAPEAAPKKMNFTPTKAPLNPANPPTST